MKRFLTSFFLLSLVCLLIPGCSSNWTKTRGSYAQNPEITTMFENREYIPEYNYFYTGFAHSPEAIVGIKKDYDLVKVSGWARRTNWQKLELNGEKLNELVAVMRKKGRPYGYYIKAPSQEQIGVLYTTSWGPLYISEIRLKDGNLLSVTPHKYNSTIAPVR